MARSWLKMAVAAGLAWSVGHAAEPALPLDPYRQLAPTVLPSTDTDWGDLAFDAAHAYLFMARHGDGLTVFDVRNRNIVANVAGTTGAHSVVLLPRFDRAYVAGTDGTLTTVALSTLTLVKWEKIVDSRLTAIVDAPAGDRVVAIAGADPHASTYLALDARTGRLVGRTVFPGSRTGKPASDGAGALFAPMRDRHVLLKLAARDLRIEQTWPLAPCEEPVAADYDDAGKRVLVACRGAAPLVVALDPATGRIVAAVPIGPDVDSLVFDRDNRVIVAASGTGASLTVIRQLDPDHYVPVETISTRPRAHALALDPATRTVYTAAAAFTIAAPAPAPGRAAPAPTYHADSFTVLPYGRVHQMTARELHDLEDEHEH
jgi:DNA-binding beta-propeller fold protein YncE